MKNRALLAALTLIAALLAGALAFGLCYQASFRPEHCQMHSVGGVELGWMRHEYHLSDAQFDQVQKLHADYAPRCAEMCQRVALHRARLAALIQAVHETSPEVVQALKETAALELECRQATLSHLYAVAAAMPPEDGQRYLAAVTASIVAPGMPGKAVNCAKTCEIKH